MHAVIGLGNPGKRFKKSRHNIGFAVVQALAELHQAGPFTQEHEADIVRFRDGQHEILLVKPLVPMNGCGLCVARIVESYSLELDHLLVVTDDFHLPLGKLRFRAKGRHGGHNGLLDIEQQLGTIEYSRLRVGIAPPNKGEAGVHVSGRFSAAEQAIVKAAVSQAAAGATMWWREGLARCMNEFNAIMPEPLL